MKVTVNLPDPVWGRLASAAENRGITVAEVIAKAIAEETRPRLACTEQLNRRQIIIALAASGHSNKHIANATGELLNFVQHVTREAGYPAKARPIGKKDQ